MKEKNTWGGVRAGAGRKKGGKNTGIKTYTKTRQKEQRTTFQFRLTDQQLEKLKSRAAAKNMNVSAFVKNILFSEKEDT